MTRTITDLQPLIQAHAFAQEEKRRMWKKDVLWLLRVVVLPSLYVSIALLITATTGVPPWDVSFLLMFLPLFLVGEQTFVEARRWLNE